jgi:hypothetical protein
MMKSTPSFKAPAPASAAVQTELDAAAPLSASSLAEPAALSKEELAAAAPLAVPAAKLTCQGTAPFSSCIAATSSSSVDQALQTNQVTQLRSPPENSG